MDIVAKAKAHIDRMVTGIEMPPSNFLDGWKDAAKYTPDLWHLERFEKVWLFVYGNEMSRHAKNVDYLGLHESQGVAYTIENFAMWKHALGEESYAIAMDKKFEFENYSWFMQRFTLPRVKIKGELYLVPPEVIINLDREYQNGVKFSRQRPMLTFPYKSVMFPSIRREKTFRAYMYIGKPEYWEEQLSVGAMNKTFVPVRNHLDKVAELKFKLQNGEITGEEFFKQMRILGFNPDEIQQPKNLVGRHYYYFTLAECMK